MSTPRARQRSLQRARVRRAQREEAADALEVERAVARDDRVVDPERVEARREQVDLVAVGGPQALGRQPLLVEERHDAGGAVMARRVVGRAREALGPAPVGDARGVVLVGQRAELRVPAGDRGAEVLGVRGQAQEAVALPELQVLVAAADHPGRPEPQLVEGEGDRAQRVVGVDDELRARTRARARESLEASDDVPGLEEHRGDEHGARALVDRAGQALGQRVRRLRRQADDLEPGFVEPRQLAAQRVELAVGGDEPRALAQVQRREQADDELVGVDAERDLAAGSPSSARKPARTRSACAKARSHFSSTVAPRRRRPRAARRAPRRARPGASGR